MKVDRTSVAVYEIFHKLGNDTDDMLKELDEQKETIRELKEQNAELKADKKDAWNKVYGKNEEVKKLKEQLESERSERENKDAKAELLLKMNTLEMKHAGK